MAVREVIVVNHPTLRKKAHKVKNFKDLKLQELIDDMVDTMLDEPGVGLAAPQVNVSQRVITVMLPDDEESKEEYGEDAGVLHVVINPEIARASDEMIEGIEGCLSIPGCVGNVSRHEAITVKGKDRKGKDIRIKAKGWLARVFQHEMDHLDGILFIDKAIEVWKMEDQSTEETSANLIEIDEETINFGEVMPEVEEALEAGSKPIQT